MDAVFGEDQGAFGVARMFGFFRQRRQAADFLEASVESEPEQREVDVIQGCRALFGPSPRALARADTQACRLTLTAEVESLFVRKGDPLLQILSEQETLRDRGQIVWGHLVQANQLLFRPDNPHTLPANIIYSSDPFFDARLSVLTRIAHGLFSQKGSTRTERELREFIRVITDERSRILRRQLPHGYCGGRSVYFATCFIQPGHRPEQHLARPAVPLLVNVEETEAVMALPSRFWPPELLAHWRG